MHIDNSEWNPLVSQTVRDRHFGVCEETRDFVWDGHVDCYAEGGDRQAT